MNYSPKDTPWNFDTTYEINSYKIEFKHLRNFAKEGPLCGQLYINNPLAELNQRMLNPSYRFSIY